MEFLAGYQDFLYRDNLKILLKQFETGKNRKKCGFLSKIRGIMAKKVSPGKIFYLSAKKVTHTHFFRKKYSKMWT